MYNTFQAQSRRMFWEPSLWERAGHCWDISRFCLKAVALQKVHFPRREREREQLHAAARLCKMVAEASAGTSRMPQCLGSKLRDLAGLKTKDQAKWYRHKADRADIGQLVRNWPTMKSCSLYAFNSSPAFPESEQPRELPQSTKKRFQGLQD